MVSVELTMDKSGATGGSGLLDWHERQLLTISSIDLSNPGHQTTIRALAFIREAP